MRKTIEFTLVLSLVVLLAAPLALAGTGDRDTTQTLKALLLEATKASLGSGPPPPAEAVPLVIQRSRSADRRSGLNESANSDDENGDASGGQDGECFGEGHGRAVDTLPGGDIDWYCIENLCPGAVIRIDVDSHKQGAPTDTYLQVFDDCDGAPLACRDDGNGFSGVTTDSCVSVLAPDSGKIWFSITNLTDVCIDANGGDCTYEVTATVTSILETEDNNACPGEDLLYIPPLESGGSADENSDLPSGGQLPCTRPGDDAKISGLIDPDGDADFFNVCLYAGEVLEVGVEAGKCNNECDHDLFDPTLSLAFFDPVTQTCGTVAAADNVDDLDPGIKFTATTSGLYVIGIDDFFGSGSQDNIYTLTAEIYQGSGDASDDCASAECLEEEVVVGDCPCNGFRNHGGYVVCVLRLAKTMLRDGLITKKEYSDMVSEAAQSDCSQPDIHSGKGDHSAWDGELKNNDIPKPPHP